MSRLGCALSQRTFLKHVLAQSAARIVLRSPCGRVAVAYLAPSANKRLAINQSFERKRRSAKPMGPNSNQLRKPRSRSPPNSRLRANDFVDYSDISSCSTVKAGGKNIKYFTHGHSGHIQDEGTIFAGRSKYVGWGLDFDLEGIETWVHFAVPSIGGGSYGVQYIQLDLKTGSVDAWVSDVHVYDGEVRFKTLQGKWNSLTTLDLGQVWTIHRGLGISVRCVRGVESMSHRFQFLDVGADFVEV
jgi:hypothetical protein